MHSERIAAIFQENFTSFGEVGASLSIWCEGREVLNLAGGSRDRNGAQPWTADTPVLIWSATKGLAAACVLHACAEHALPLDTPVAAVWPEFASAGKDAVTIAELLSHRAGLSALSREVPVLDHRAVADALAEERPQWTPGSAHGYHPRTFGFLVDEMIRRLSGIPLGSYWRSRFAEPLALDAWIGIDPARAESIAPVFAARTAPSKEDRFYREFATVGSLTGRSFASPRGLHSVSAMNSLDARTASLPAFGGIATAHALGKFYAILAEGGSFAGKRFFEQITLDSMGTTLVDGPDRVLLMDTAFSAGFMKDPVDANGQKTRAIFGPSQRAFGHPGAGGSIAFADPEHRIAFAYVMNQMEPGVLPNAKALRLIEALYA